MQKNKSATSAYLHRALIRPIASLLRRLRAKAGPERDEETFQ